MKVFHRFSPVGNWQMFIIAPVAEFRSVLYDLHARSKICCSITAYSLKFKNKQKGKHEVAWKMSNASKQYLGGRKCKGKSGAKRVLTEQRE